MTNHNDTYQNLKDTGIFFFLRIDDKICQKNDKTLKKHINLNDTEQKTKNIWLNTNDT